MAKVTLKINGQEVEVEKGTTILEAAKQLGIYIPTLCYHPYLPLEEACRICVVEDIRGGWSTLVAGCVFPVRNGMVIETESEKVIESRRTIMELLLSDHPNDCMTCYATGECELQDMAYLYKVKPTAFEGGERHKYEIDPDPNPELHLNMNKCILCRRCIRACSEIQGADVWTKVGRGFDQRISTAFDLPTMEAGCELCGHCVDFCPVDAIGWRRGRDEVRSWQLKPCATVCLQCSMGCRAAYDVLDEKVVRVRGDFASPANMGALCKMGRFNFDFINSPDRVRTACLKDGDGLAPCSLEDGLKTAASALEKVRDTDGGNAIGVVCGGMLTNEEYYLAQKLARGALACNNVDNIDGPWQQVIYDGLASSTGLGAMSNTLGDIAKAGAVLALGADTIEKHAIAGIRARKASRQGGILIVAHPQQVPLTKTATKHLAVKEGSEDALVLGLIKTIIEEELYDKDYLEQYTQEFDKLQRNIEKIGMGELTEKTGLGEQEIRETAQLYASKKPACLIYGVDRKTAPLNETFYRMCAALQMLLGSLGVEGGGVNVMGCTGNAQGAIDFGAVAKYLPGYSPVTRAAARKTVGKLWGVEPSDQGGLSWPEMFEAIEKGEMKALYLIGVDPFELGYPRAKVEGALSRLSLLVVQDCVKNRAFDYAHVVLPSLSFIEKEGTATNCERRVQRLHKALTICSDARSDFELINGVLSNLNPELKAESLAATFAEAVQLIKELDGLSFEQIPDEGVQWPVDGAGAGTVRLGLPEEEKARFKFYAARL
ncbi:molybdopterin-dependent oxidoreductase [Desulfoferrobacter suflitae]|uniref:molybdopterin-dependent oxidoreductase n=1 Tax=Desulfoferrobacter suflitae TaxID=2865782 RepID=UPI002164CD23|nr:molybdopterin-dependent oxidoreductase [Desulfoferrobacter suflitae]MCK8602007.1 molybdopterin-dependent oxidoreductase [Desulfoferrobacter suflitae]